MGAAGQKSNVFKYFFANEAKNYFEYFIYIFGGSYCPFIHPLFHAWGVALETGEGGGASGE